MSIEYPPEVRLSYSTLQTLNSCPRKFELARVRNPLLLDHSFDETLHTSVGKAIHTGLQSLWLYGDIDRAVIECWIEYSPHLEEESAAKHWGTMYEGLLQLIERFSSSGWRLWGSRVEYSYCIWLDRARRHYYCGFMDGVLLNQDGRIACGEIKTTGMKGQSHIIEGLYANSNQGLGNSIVLDSLVPEHSSWKMVYPILQFRSARLIDTYLLEFEKTRADRLEWLQSLLMTYNRIQEMLEYQLFPRNGSACVSFNQLCPFFGGCDTVGEEWSPAKEGPEGGWDIEFDLDELIERQLQ